MKQSATTPDYVFLSLVGILVLFGLIALSSASSVFSYERFGSSFYLIRHQLMFGLLPGVVAFAFALYMPYGFWRKYALYILLFTVGLLVLVLIPGIGRQLGGARSWFTFASISFQPSELVKLSLLIYLAAWAETRYGRLADFKEGFVPFMTVAAGVAFLIVLQPDVGTFSILGGMILFLAFVIGIRLPYLGGVCIVGILLLLLLIKIAPYRAARITAFAHPELDPQGVGYQINQALLAVGSGGFFGVGFGHSRQKFRYLPEVTGDAIFPIIAEEWGFFVSAGFVIFLIALIWRMFRIARDAPDYFSKYLVAGFAGWFGIQSFVNIGSMVGLLPLTGLPLPFVSYGGTALAVELAAVGIVGSISRHT
ncbi:MAG: putative lipid II flippase FtsW [bacterium]|nr:putative lipid II flippase FtsW [bacterium]